MYVHFRIYTYVCLQREREREMNVYLNAMLEAVKFPAGIANLNSGLANVDRNALSHLRRIEINEQLRNPKNSALLSLSLVPLILLSLSPSLLYRAGKSTQIRRDLISPVTDFAQISSIDFFPYLKKEKRSFLSLSLNGFDSCYSLSL